MVNTHITEVPREEIKENGKKYLKTIMAWNFPSWETGINVYIYEVQQTTKQDKCKENHT